MGAIKNIAVARSGSHVFVRYNTCNHFKSSESSESSECITRIIPVSSGGLNGVLERLAGRLSKEGFDEIKVWDLCGGGMFHLIYYLSRDEKKFIESATHCLYIANK